MVLVSEANAERVTAYFGSGPDLRDCREESFTEDAAVKAHLDSRLDRLAKHCEALRAQKGGGASAQAVQGAKVEPVKAEENGGEKKEGEEVKTEPGSHEAMVVDATRVEGGEQPPESEGKDKVSCPPPPTHVFRSVLCLCVRVDEVFVPHIWGQIYYKCWGGGG